MAWANRGTGKYYYRSVRTPAGIITQYLGRGRQAEEAARQVEERRRAAAAERCLLFDQQALLREVDLVMREFQAEVRLLVRAALVAAGNYQTASREWRRKRRSGHGRHDHSNIIG